MNHLIVHQENHVCQIGFNRPAVRNNIDQATCLALIDELIRADQDPQVHCVVLHGDESIFCSGLTLQELMNRSEESAVSFEKLINTLLAFKKPLLAAVRGPAVGLGVALLLYCDIVYCGKSSMFSVPATALGLTPEHGLTQGLAIRAGYHKACEKLLLSEPFTANEALQMNLVNDIFDDEHVLEQTLGRAQRLCRLPLGSVMATKALLRQGLAQELAPHLHQETLSALARQQSAEAKEAFSAFKEGRQPDFSTIDPNA